MSPPSFFADALPTHARERTSQLFQKLPHLPGCSFSIRPLSHHTFLIREQDEYHDYPHIYAKIVFNTATSEPLLIVLSDTGSGSNGENPQVPTDELLPQPGQWNIASFLQYTINPGGRIPYLVMLSHCHYDHILGLNYLPPTIGNIFTTDGMRERHRRLPANGCHGDRHVYLCPIDSREFQSTSELRKHYSQHSSSHPNSTYSPPTTVLASRYGLAFVTPYANLAKNSMCDELGIKTPHYRVHLWARDNDEIVVHAADAPFINTARSSLDVAEDDDLDLASISTYPIVRTGLTLLQIPGHTPDSLSWYDAASKTIYVGDHMYERVSDDSLHSPWPAEPPMPTIFTTESNLVDWWQSHNKLINFVAARDHEAQIQHRQDLQDWQDRQEYDFISLDEIDDTFIPSSNPATHPPQPTLTLLSAAHVTADIPALSALILMRTIMAAVLADSLPWKPLGHVRGEETRLWDANLDSLDDRDRAHGLYTFSVQAPLRLVEEARKGIPREEWDPVVVQERGTFELLRALPRRPA